MAIRMKKKGIVVHPLGFYMHKSPVDVQLTKHINNLLFTKNWDKKSTLETFKNFLKGIDSTDKISYRRIKEIVNYYGIMKCRQWFTEIYGWEFNNNE